MKKKKNLKKDILEKIKSEKIQMEPRWKFVLRMWEQRALWCLLIFASVLSVSGIAFFAQRYNPRDLFEYGSVGWQVFYEDFPYYWLAGAIIFWILAIKAWLNLGENYRITTKKIFIAGALLLTTTIGLILFLS